MEENKIWLKLEKQFSIGRESKKFNWKNIKYTIKKILNLYLIKLDILKDINDAFYINKLYVLIIDFFSSQLVDNTQSFLIQDNNKNK